VKCHSRLELARKDTRSVGLSLTSRVRRVDGAVREQDREHHRLAGLMGDNVVPIIARGNLLVGV
jgi:hypothetical protein